MKKLSSVLLLIICWSMEASAQAPYYQGKQIKIVVGNTAGGFFDRWARLLARYMPKYTPGGPEFIVQNMPGAGSIVAMNYVYNVAKPDGLTLGMPNPAIYLDQLVGRSEVSLTYENFSGSARPSASRLFFICVRMRLSSRSPRCGTPNNRPDAAPRAHRVPITSWRGCSRTPFLR